jgi:tetratricopeptide (TPR) repeat protein
MDGSSGISFQFWVVKTSWFFILILALGACTEGSPDEVAEENRQIFGLAWKEGASPRGDSLRKMLAGRSQRDSYVLYCRSWLLKKNGQAARALKTADSLTMGYPSFPEGYYLRANLRADAGDNEGALRDYGKALARKPTFPEAYINRGSLHFQMKHADEALADFRAAIRLEPRRPDAWFNAANAFAVMSHADSACYFWEKARLLGSFPADSLLRKHCSGSNP